MCAQVSVREAEGQCVLGISAWRLSHEKGISWGAGLTPGSPDSVCRVPRSARVLQPQGSCTLRQKPTLPGIAAGHRGWAFRATGWEGPASP